jgi:Ser/Thr protein kinase RdoA (MazF antagonist)
MSEASSTTGAKSFDDGRERFSPEELVCVLSHYDLGIVSGVEEFPRGSRKAPKVLLKTERGNFILKRRAKGKDDPFKVAFTHAIQLYLAARAFPVPALVGTRRDDNSLLQWSGNVYEIYQHIIGGRFNSDVEETFAAGEVLGKFHRLIRQYEPEFPPMRGSYHDYARIPTALTEIPARLSMTDENTHGREEDVLNLCRQVHEAYADAVRRVNDLGFNLLEQQIVHSDWHPGNLMFRSGRVVAVIDYDTARLAPRVTDVANGTLQFSFMAGQGPPSEWPLRLDTRRVLSFLRGYEAEQKLLDQELAMVPWLMMEAVIAEAVLPIAATGAIGPHKGFEFLEMVAHKIQWMAEELPALMDLVQIPVATE